MDQLAALASGASKTRRANDDDFIDRLSSRYTVVMLVVFAVLVSMNQYVRNPITCWAPVHFTDAHTKFTIAYCWVKNTYYLPWEDELPRDDGPEYRQMVPYYQWIPFILLGQAVLFYAPSVVWHALNSKAGVDSDNIMQTVQTMARVENGDTRDDLQGLLTNLIDRFLVNRGGTRPPPSSRWRPVEFAATIHRRIFSIRSGTYLLFLFLFSKICYILNAIGQLVALNHVLGAKYSTFGYDVLRDVIAKHDWTEESYVAFPRVTLCDFKIRGQDLGNTQSYTVQCVLPVNLYVEKIYMFLWFWMVGVAAVSLVSFFVWLVRAIFVKDQIKFVRNHLIAGGQMSEFRGGDGADQLEAFTVKYLQQDGAFLMRLIAHNTNNVTTTETVCALWNFWKEKEKERATSKDENFPDPTNSETLVLKRSVE